MNVVGRSCCSRRCIVVVRDLLVRFTYPASVRTSCSASPGSADPVSLLNIALTAVLKVAF
jgi:hypothetical protein